MKTREPASKFLTAEEILSNAKDHRFIRWVRSAYAKGRLSIRCHSLQERHEILQLLLGSASVPPSAKLR